PAQISYQKLHATWTYDSALTVKRDVTTGRPLVHWQPSVVHPRLHDGQTLTTGPAGSVPVKALDRNGTELTKDDYPSLGGVLKALGERYGEKAGGTQGVELQIQDKAKTATTTAPADSGETLLTLSKPTPG